MSTLIWGRWQTIQPCRNGNSRHVLHLHFGSFIWLTNTVGVFIFLQLEIQATKDIIRYRVPWTWIVQIEQVFHGKERRKRRKEINVIVWFFLFFSSQVWGKSSPKNGLKKSCQLNWICVNKNSQVLLDGRQSGIDSKTKCKEPVFWPSSVRRRGWWGI